MPRYQKLEEVKDFMEKNEMSYSDMGNLLGVDRATLHYMLNSGGAYPVIDVITKFELLKSNPEDFKWENS